MVRRYNNMVSHDFYCLNCGKKTITLMRKIGKQKERFHRKKLFCPWCKNDVNAVECKTQQDVDEFLDKYNKGEFVEEAKESMNYIINSPMYNFLHGGLK